MTWRERMRDKRERRRTQRDRELITYGGRFAVLNESMPVRCAECGRYGHVLGAVAARTDRGVAILDRQCAIEEGARFLTLGECVERAAALGIELRPKRASSPVGVITAQPDYENAALIFNATTGRLAPGHIAQMGAAGRRG
ncbi:hypothetical protein [Streptomyces sp. enrichment culture]|uniref:hypothetical protein n=1 Tax=Streptomyces sp. enrichment culture TaxID=1795815 RepID=UPI003F5800EB